MSYNFKNLVFEGGGVKGIAYGGALEILAQKGILANIERVAGTSAGAITAGLLAVGYTDQEIQEILKVTCFKSFMDASFWGPIDDIRRVVCSYGWYAGEKFQNWFESKIEEKTGIKQLTFAQLAQKIGTNKNYRLLYVFGTNLNRAQTDAFNADDTPNTAISEAVRISMSIPLFFEAVALNKFTYVDGGIYYNYPIDAFDNKKYVSSENSEPAPYNPNPAAVYNKETLGLRVDGKDVSAQQQRRIQNSLQQVSNIMQYATVFVEGVLNNLNKIHLHKNDWQRTIFIDSLGVSVTDFSLDQGTIQKLIQSGRDCTTKYFNWFDNPPTEDKPMNK